MRDQRTQAEQDVINFINEHKKFFLPDSNYILDDSIKDKPDVLYKYNSTQIGIELVEVDHFCYKKYFNTITKEEKEAMKNIETYLAENHLKKKIILTKREVLKFIISILKNKKKLYKSYKNNIKGDIYLVARSNKLIDFKDELNYSFLCIIEKKLIHIKFPFKRVFLIDRNWKYREIFRKSRPKGRPLGNPKKIDYQVLNDEIEITQSAFKIGKKYNLFKELDSSPQFPSKK